MYERENGVFFFFRNIKGQELVEMREKLFKKKLAYSYKALLLLACSKNNLAFKTSNGTFLVC